MSAYRLEAPVAEKAVAEVEEAAEQLARKAMGAAPQPPEVRPTQKRAPMAALPGQHANQE
jgi:hypothetical protein